VVKNCIAAAGYYGEVMTIGASEVTLQAGLLKVSVPLSDLEKPKITRRRRALKNRGAWRRCRSMRLNAAREHGPNMFSGNRCARQRVDEH